MSRGFGTVVPPELLPPESARIRPKCGATGARLARSRAYARAIYWLFVTGLAVDIAGGILVLGGIIFERRQRRVTRGLLFPGPDEPPLEAQREPAFVLVGATLLASGFVMQIAGYTVASGHAYFAFFAAGVIALVTASGYFVADRPVSRFMHRRALKAWGEMVAEREARKSPG